MPRAVGPSGPRPLSTHGVTVEGDTAVKRFQSPNVGDERRLYGNEALREWRTQGDPNLANHLWDGHDVHLVDFEASGRGDRATELADFVEHPTVWAHAGIDAAAFLDRFGLSPDQCRRVTQLRRLFAAFWIMRLRPGGSAYQLNPLGTFERQAARLLDLLGSA